MKAKFYTIMACEQYGGSAAFMLAHEVLDATIACGQYEGSDTFILACKEAAEINRKAILKRNKQKAALKKASPKVALQKIKYVSTMGKVSYMYVSEKRATHLAQTYLRKPYRAISYADTVLVIDNDIPF